MGLGTLIDLHATPMNSERYIMPVRVGCDGEGNAAAAAAAAAAASTNNDRIQAVSEHSSVHLSVGLQPEVKDAHAQGHLNLRHAMLSAEAHEDVPTDPFVSSARESDGNKVCTANGDDAMLPVNQRFGERFDCGCFPHDPEPSTSNDGVPSEQGDMQQAANTAATGRHIPAKLAVQNGNANQLSANGLHGTAQSVKNITAPLSVSVPIKNECIVSTGLSQQYPLSVVSKHDQFIVNDTQQGGDYRRAFIGTAPLSPNHYGSILAPASPSFQVNRHLQLSDQCKTSLSAASRGFFPCKERSLLNATVKEMQQKRQKMQEVFKAAPHPTLSSLSLAADGVTDERLQIPNEQTLNKALDLLRKPAQDETVTESKTATKRTYSKRVTTNTVADNKDGLNRKILQEKIGKLRDKNGLALSVPHLERAHLSQLVNLLQRFKSHFAVSEYLSKEVLDYVFDDGTVVASGKQNDSRNIAARKSECWEDRLTKFVVDPDVTESEDTEEENEGQMPSTSSAHFAERSLPSYAYYRERVQLGTLDAKVLCLEEDCEEKISIIYRQLDNIRKQKKSAYFSEKNASDDCCTRCLPFDGSRRRFLKRRIDRTGEIDLVGRETSPLDTEQRVRSYAAVDSRVCPQLSLLSTLPVERRAELYCRRRSTRPVIHLRKRFDRSPWTTFLEERKVAVKEAVIVDDRQTRRKREKSESDRSYDDDEEYQPPANFSRRNSYSKRTTSALKRAGQKLVRRSLDRKRNGDFRTRRFPDHHRFRPSRTNDVDEALMEPMPGLPQKIDYKEICIPHWECKPLKLVPEDDSECMHLAECSSIAEISRRHLPYELNERKRFQQYRDYVAAKSAATASKLSGSSHSKIRAASTVPSAAGSVESLSMMESVQSASAAASPAAAYSVLDDDQPTLNSSETTTVPDYDRPSAALPYSPRSFAIPSCCASRSMKNCSK